MNNECDYLYAGDSPVVLVGGGGHCRSVIDVLESTECAIAGIVHGPESHLKPVLGYPALGRDSDLASLAKQYRLALVAVGQIRNPNLRMRLHARLLDLGYRLPAVRSRFAHVSRHATVGAGSVIMHGAIVNAGARIGDNAIINSCALIEHDCHIGSHCHIAVGATVAGCVTVAERTFIGAGAIIRDHIRIGYDCIIGIGSQGDP